MQNADTWEAEHSTDTPKEDAWREEEQWAEESQPSGPYKEEEPANANAEAWEAMSREEASEDKAYESEGTRPAAALGGEEQVWEEHPQWEEPAAGWEASGEQASGQAEHAQEWASDGAAAAEERNNDGSVRNAVTNDAYSNEQPGQEWREDSPAWSAAGDNSEGAKQSSEDWVEDAEAWNTVVDGK